MLPPDGLTLTQNLQRDGVLRVSPNLPDIELLEEPLQSDPDIPHRNRPQIHSVLAVRPHHELPDDTSRPSLGCQVIDLGSILVTQIPTPLNGLLQVISESRVPHLLVHPLNNITGTTWVSQWR